MKSMGEQRLWTKNFICIWVINLTLSIWGFMIHAPFPFYIIHLGGNELIVGITAGVVSIAAMMMRPFAGWFLDNVSRRALFVVGALVIIAASFVLYAVPILAIAILLRILMGFMFSAATTASNTNAADAIPPKRFGEGIGLLGLGNTLGTAFGPMIGLGIMGMFGFPPLFITSAVIMLAAFLVSKVFSFKSIDKANRKKIELKKLLNKDALPASIVLMLASMPFGGVVLFVALYGEQYGIGNGAIYFMLIAVGSGTARLLGGRIIDRRGEKPMVIFGNACFVAALVLLIPHMAVAYYLSGLFFGLGFGVMNPAMQAMAMRIVPTENRGSATSTFQISHDISGGLGGILAGWIVTHWGYAAMFASLIIFVFISYIVYFSWAAKSPSAFGIHKNV